jgi:DNA repair protein RadC
MRVLFLDAANRLVADEVMGRGTVDHAPVYPREIVRRALVLQASSFVLVHNHPSGDVQPSAEDMRMTGQIIAAARVVGLSVADHLIVGREQVLSMKEAGLL